ncbi:Bacterial regulatory proteins, luxR family [Bacteroides uniformis]|uniref:LuxR family transcriptional regulator n=2 Tax=Bacteroides uniformis TaxID=820 RepID=A0A3E4PYM4_BACUN|nr:LuxR C-terminal-related transcriptional regulator [Bacteroides uniformis]RJV09302.1 LuxR family transcriptional regulator [Bacteroides sp. AF29-11]MBV3896267.1 LuxR C-terminal-related transcriptional regulator [Bacteroides uniformis]MBV3900380.1 LuxR C-terminal-related transcriptional regulator [Bacteroides uniformis]MBV3918463.1 LuxR C-terminal-related transcriptional regulator [Bacteroides uniformis]
MEKMRNILYICIMLLGIMCFVGCNDCHGNKKLLAQTDSLLQSRPDSALKLLNSIEKDVGFSEAEWMQFVWNCAQARYRMGMSLAEDSLLPEAIHYYRERKDSSRMLDGYLLEASYYKWMKQEERMDEAIENGLDYAIARKDTFWLLLFYRGKAEVAYQRNDHSQVIELMEKILQYADKLSVRERSSVFYNLGLNMALINHPSSSDYFERSIDMALAAADTASACHYMRNYATALANNREYVKSNDLLRRVKRLMPAVGNHVMLQITFAENFLNLHQLDSARYYWNQAWANEQNHGGDKAEGFSVRSALVQLKTVLDYTSGTPLDIITFGRFADSVRVEMRDQNSVIEQQLETKNNLQRLNYELIIKRQKTRMYSVLVAVLLVGVLLSLSFYIRNRRKRLAEAEERIDTLTRLLEDAQKASDNQEENSDAFFKKLLLQQLGIIRLVANTPTSQNQALLKLISGISNKEIPVEGLLAWADLYPVIDRLYDGFYSRMVERFGQLLSDKEVQICCLLCAGFSTKEIGVVTQQTSATIYVRKTSIRKKINAGEKQDIVECIRGI